MEGMNQQPVQITVSNSVVATPISPSVKQEIKFGSAMPEETETKKDTKTPKPTCEASELVEEIMEASDGEIMDGEENAETIKMNKIQ